MERRSKKFMLALSPSERVTLQRLAECERVSAADVVRRLIWREAERLNVIADRREAQAQEVCCG